MARADATHASARLYSSIGLSAPVSREEYRRRLIHERLIRFAIPILLASMAVAVAYSLMQHFVSSHSEAIFAAQRDLKQSSALRAAILRAGGAEALARSVGADEVDQNAPDFIISDSVGAVWSTSLVDGPRTLNEVFLAPLMRPSTQGDAPVALTMAKGGDALIHVRQLPEGRLLYTMRAMESVTSQWWQRIVGISMLVGSALIALLAVGIAYYLQAVRANHADRICDTLSERMQLALSRGRCGIWDWQISSNTLQWSSSMFELLGLPTKDAAFSFTEVRQLAHLDDLPILQGIEETIRAGTGGIDQEFRLRHSEGRWVTLHLRADVVKQGLRLTTHLVGFAVDVTEQRNLDMQRRSSDLRLRDAIESIPEAFVLWDSDNRLVVCNENYRRFQQIDLDKIAPAMSYEELHAASRSPGPMRVVPIAGEGIVEHDHSYEAELADGRWLQISERRTKDGGFVSIGTDITARKEQAERLMENEQRLLALLSDQQRDRRTLELQAMKLSEMARKYREQYQLAQAATVAKSAFLANMSHELRTPLNAIVGFAQMMEQKLFGSLGSQRYEDYVTDIRKSGIQMLDMVSDLLQMSRIEAGKAQLSPVLSDIGTPIGRALQAVRPMAAAKSIDIQLGQVTGLSAMLDAEATTQIVTHLVGNAVKFSHSGSAIDIRARRANGCVNIFIADRGLGIPAKVIPLLGKPFEQQTQKLQNGMKGSGLGLAIATSLAALQGGSVKIRSRVGRGTILMVTLPETAETGRHGRPGLARPHGPSYLELPHEPQKAFADGIPQFREAS
jgi:two-component system, cell cycle sensor histidine kinase PleC